MMNIDLAQAGDKEVNALRLVTGHDFTGAPIDRSSSMGSEFRRAKNAQNTQVFRWDETAGPAES